MERDSKPALLRIVKRVASSKPCGYCGNKGEGNCPAGGCYEFVTYLRARDALKLDQKTTSKKGCK